MIGLIFGMPIGVVGTMSIHRTIYYGPFIGFMSGFASSCADAVFACIGAFGLTLIADTFLKYQIAINLIGALFLLVIAIKIMMKKEQFEISKIVEHKGLFPIVFSSFMVAITNPTAIMSFLFAFSVFEISGPLNFIHGTQLIVGVFLGTICWWGLLVIIVNRIKKKLNALWMQRLNKTFGIILIVLSFAIVLKVL